MEKSLTEIASIIGVHRSSIKRELKRNADLEKYHYASAQEKSIHRTVLKDSMKVIIESEVKLRYLTPLKHHLLHFRVEWAKILR
jgi:IS30 family transposase